MRKDWLDDRLSKIDMWVNRIANVNCNSNIKKYLKILSAQNTQEREERE